jgi:hypothetical protein
MIRVTRILPFLLVAALCAQSAGPVRRIYVNGLSPDDVRKDLIAALRKSKLFDVVATADQADAVLSGGGKIWRKGFYSLNPRAGTSPSNGQPVYGGFLSVELKDRHGETLWSYLATPRSGSTDAAGDLSRDVVKHLAGSLSKGLLGPAGGKN